MGYEVCVFGVPAESATREQILTSVQGRMRDLRYSIDLPNVYVVTNSDDQAHETGLRLFMIGSNERRDYLIDRHLVVEHLRNHGGLDLLVFLVDDRRGIYLFERVVGNQSAGGGSTCLLMSDGPYWGGTLDVSGVDFPQRHYSNAELRALHAKDESELTDPERAAIKSYTDALTIAFAKYFPKMTRKRMVGISHEKTACLVQDFGGGRPMIFEPRELTSFHNIMAFWPTNKTWEKTWKKTGH